MFNEYKKVNVDFETLEKEVTVYNEPYLLTVKNGGDKFEFLIHMKPNADKLIILGSGAYNPEKQNLPVFQRYSWMTELNESVIFYNDPTLYLGEMSLGWGYGTNERHYLKDIAHILHVIYRKYSIKEENILFYGSSAGGFMSMVLAGYIKGAKALVNNPQTNVLKYYEKHVKNLYQAIYNCEDKDFNKFKVERLNIIAFFKEIQYVPPIEYHQNLLCNHDVNYHLIPFIKELKTIDEKVSLNNLTTRFYSNKEQGHNPLSKEETLKIIADCLRG